MAVLITAALTSAAYQLARVINAPELIYADQSEIPSIPGVKSIVLPKPDSMSFAHEALKLALDYNIDTIYPLKLDEVLELSAAKQLFDEYGIKLMIPSAEWLKNNLEILPFNSPDIIVIENGSLKAGNFPVSKIDQFPETGVFKWRVSGTHYSFNLYLS